MPQNAKGRAPREERPTPDDHEHSLHGTDSPGPLFQCLSGQPDKPEDFDGQEALILRFLEAPPSKGVTAAEALLELGVARLASRISAMGQKGIKFRKAWETHTKAAGRGTARVVRYFLDCANAPEAAP